MSNDRKNSITYEQFGAVGDGICDDFAAIRAAHEFANERGLDVHATNGKTYYIHKTDGRCAEVQTNTYWNGAKFIFDDSGIKTHRPCGCADCIERSTSIFHVKASRDLADVVGVVVVKAVNAPIVRGVKHRVGGLGRQGALHVHGLFPGAPQIRGAGGDHVLSALALKANVHITFLGARGKKRTLRKRR